MGQDMKDFGVVTLFSVIISAAAPRSDPQPRPVQSTAKSTEAFAHCFAKSQDRRSASWAFVPRARGGTFSNLGATSVAAPYFLLIRDRGTHREVELQNAAPGGVQQKGVEECI